MRLLSKLVMWKIHQHPVWNLKSLMTFRRVASPALQRVDWRLHIKGEIFTALSCYPPSPDVCFSASHPLFHVSLASSWLTLNIKYQSKDPSNEATELNLFIISDHGVKTLWNMQGEVFRVVKFLFCQITKSLWPGSGAQVIGNILNTLSKGSYRLSTTVKGFWTKPENNGEELVLGNKNKFSYNIKKRSMLSG